MGLDAYQAAGGRVQRDLFTEDGGGWLADLPLLERLMGERIQAAADQVKTEGWLWVTTDPSATRIVWYNTRRVWPEAVELSEADQARKGELVQLLDAYAAEYPYGVDDAAEDVWADVEATRAELDALEQRESAFRPEDIACAGAMVTLAGDGTIRVERGFVRPEDEPQPEPATEDPAQALIHAPDEIDDEDGSYGKETGDTPVAPAFTPEPVAEDKAPTLSADLEAELSAHRTVALRAEIMRQPGLALRVLAHGLATAAFYGAYMPTVARMAYAYGMSSGTGGIPADSPARQAITAAEDEQRARLPNDQGTLWEWLQSQDVPTLHALIAVCVGRVSDAGGGDWTDGRHTATQVAQAAGLDMRQWWTATRSSYFSRVTKVGIVAAVRDGAGEGAARRIEGMSKDGMAANAEMLLAGTGWLPARLRVPGAADTVAAPVAGNSNEPMEYPAAAE